MKLQNKTAIITGGGSGIGRAISINFASEGAEVIILDMDENGGTETQNLIAKSGGKATFQKCDISNQSFTHSIIQSFKTVDILVNNAGIAHVGNLENCSEADFDKIYQVNVKGVYNCLSAVLPKMKAQKSGVILNMASVASTIGIPDRFAYSMSKGAVVGMTLSVARDYVSDGVRCNCISPGRVHTPFVDGFLAKNYPGQENEMFEKLSKTQPIGRMGTPDEIAKLSLFLCSDDAAFITGVDYAIDGGFVHLKM